MPDLRTREEQEVLQILRDFVAPPVLLHSKERSRFWKLGWLDQHNAKYIIFPFPAVTESVLGPAAFSAPATRISALDVENHLRDRFPPKDWLYFLHATRCPAQVLASGYLRNSESGTRTGMLGSWLYGSTDAAIFYQNQIGFGSVRSNYVLSEAPPSPESFWKEFSTTFADLDGRAPTRSSLGRFLPQEGGIAGARSGYFAQSLYGVIAAIRHDHLLRVPVGGPLENCLKRDKYQQAGNLLRDIYNAESSRAFMQTIWECFAIEDLRLQFPEWVSGKTRTELGDADFDRLAEDIKRLNFYEEDAHGSLRRKYHGLLVPNTYRTTASAPPGGDTAEGAHFVLVDNSREVVVEDTVPSVPALGSRGPESESTGPVPNTRPAVPLLMLQIYGREADENESVDAAMEHWARIGGVSHYEKF